MPPQLAPRALPLVGAPPAHLQSESFILHQCRPCRVIFGHFCVFWQVVCTEVLEDGDKAAQHRCRGCLPSIPSPILLSTWGLRTHSDIPVPVEHPTALELLAELKFSSLSMRKLYWNDPELSIAEGT